jgi:hypothetical protein
VPQPRYHGPDRFRYTVSDGPQTATATVELTITPVNHPPQWTSTPPSRWEVPAASVDRVFPVSGTMGFDRTPRNTAFTGEIGLYRVDGAGGRVGPLVPGDPGYATETLAGARAQTLFKSGPVPGRNSQAGLPAGRHLGFYLLPNGSSAPWRSSNPRNVVGQGPLALFSMPTAHTDRFDYLHGAWQTSGGLRLAWADPSRIVRRPSNAKTPAVTERAGEQSAPRQRPCAHAAAKGLPRRNPSVPA